MSELPPDVREKTDVLDAVGNTTAASGKGFAIASAALTALALFAAFVGVAEITGIDIYKAKCTCLFICRRNDSFHLFFSCDTCSR
jgi:K(+)-stimulated pyrophosphate-energized sodium pump